MSVEEAITAFYSETKAGSDFVCICYHRMMYRKTVVLCNKGKYNKVSPDLLDGIFSANLDYISSDGKEYICKTCDRALARGSMPVQAKANGLHLSKIPPELSGLNALEQRLISLRVPFMKIVALPSGKQRASRLQLTTPQATPTYTRGSPWFTLAPVGGTFVAAKKSQTYCIYTCVM